MCLRKKGTEVPVAEVSLNNEGLSHQPEQGRLQLHRSTDGLKDTLDVVTSRLQPHHQLTDDSVRRIHS